MQLRSPLHQKTHTLTKPIQVKPTPRTTLQYFVRRSVVAPQPRTTDAVVISPRKEEGYFQGQLWSGVLLATTVSLVWSISQVDLEYSTVVGLVLAAVVTESLSLLDSVKNILSWRGSPNGVPQQEKIVEDGLVNAFKPSQPQDTKQKQEKAEDLTEEQEEEEWMDKEEPTEITEEYQEETPATSSQPEAKQEGSQNDREESLKVFDMEEYEKEKQTVEETPLATRSIVIDYETTWPKAILHGSLNGGDWGDLAECQEVKSFTINIEDKEESESVPLLEFVVTDGNGDWDHSSNGENYSIFKPGQYGLKDGVLTHME